MTIQKRRNSTFEWRTAFIQSGLTGNTGFVGLLMSTLDNGDGKGFFVSAAKVAEWTGLNEKTVREQIKRLVEQGWVVRTSRGGRRGGQNRASTYRLEVPKGQAVTLAPQAVDLTFQPEPVTPPVDQRSLVQSPLDLSTLSEGDEISSEALRGLEPEQMICFTPSFDRDEMWVYTPHVTSSREGTGQPVENCPPPLSPVQERQRRASFARQNREEGFDESGMPIEKDRQQRSSSGYRSRGR